MSYFYHETFQNVESGQLIQLKTTTSNVDKSRKVIV
jgi:hypothetical protein